MAMLDFNMAGLPQFGVNPMQGGLTPVPWAQKKGGFMDRFNQVLNPYGGLLGEDNDLVRQQGLLGLASGLLSASGPSPTRISLGQALGQGLQGMQQGQQGAARNVMAAQQMAGKLPSAGPASVQEWQYYNSLPEKDQKRYLEMKRQMYSVANIGGVPSQVPRSPGMPVVPLSTLPTEVEAAAALEAGKTGARVEAAGRTEAALDLPKVEKAAETTTKLIDQLVAHPGKKWAIGAPSVLPTVPGTAQAGFVSRLDQLKGQQFQQAYETLKGSGQITEIEGLKAENAIARMGRAQSVEEFDQAAQDFKDSIKSATSIKRQRAGAPTRRQVPADPLGLR